MALDVAKLKAEFLKLFDKDDPGFVGFPADVATAAANFATAYDTYAQDAEDASGDAVATTFKPLMVAQLALLPPGNPGGTEINAATVFSSAFVAYWTGGIFAIGTPPAPTAPCPSEGGNGIWASEASSLVTAVIPAPLLGDLFTAPSSGVFASQYSDPDAAATAMADAWHLATTSDITVVITGVDTTPPPGGPLPITNTCTVF